MSRYPDIRRRTWLQRFYLSTRAELYRGVRLSTVFLAGEAEKVAIAKVRAALDLLHDVSPQQLERIPRLLNGVTVARLPINLGAWQPMLGAAILDRDFVLNPVTAPARIASLVIHELTHARLDAVGFRQAAQPSDRYERICYLAERNFIARLPDTHLRRELEELNQRYLDAVPWYFSEEAVARRRAEWRAKQPVWRRIVFDVLQSVGRGIAQRLPNER